MAKVGGPLPGSPVLTATAPNAATVNLTKGMAVSYTGNNEVQPTADGGEVNGQVLDTLVNKNGALVSVVGSGVLVFKYTGTAPTVGASVQGSATAGVVKAAALNVPTNAARRPLVVAVNTANTTVDVLL